MYVFIEVCADFLHIAYLLLSTTSNDKSNWSIVYWMYHYTHYWLEHISENKILL